MSKSPEQLSNSKVEKIARAAILYGDHVYVGLTHGEIFDDLENTFDDFDENQAKMGFITDADRFVDRKEAKEIAEVGNQYSPPTGVKESAELSSGEYK